MKWRKQMTAMWDDERVARLVSGGGSDALACFGLYCRLLDIVAGQMDARSSQCAVTYPVSRWSLLLSVRGSHVRHWLEKVSVTGLLTVEWVSGDIRVTIPKLLKYRDEYSSKSGQTTHKEQNRTDTEEEQKVEEAKAASPPAPPAPPEPPKPKPHATPIRGDDAFERMYSRHPRKKDRGLSQTNLAQSVAAGADLAEIDRVHGLYCEREWINGEERFAPTLAQWLLDQGWKYEPKARDPTNGKKKRDILDDVIEGKGDYAESRADL